MKKKILIADDDPRLRALVRATLGDDFHLLQARDGQEALEQAIREKPHLVILDVLMPGLDGFEVCRRLKANNSTRQARVLMLTCKDRSEDLRRGREAGADAYFTKPFSPLALLDKINDMLNEVD